jgi:heme exporter protein C
MFHLAKPTYFIAFKNKVFPWLCAFAFFFFCFGLWQALRSSPPDYQQGEMVRLMYVHVPASWMALGIYTFMAGASVVGFIFRTPLADLSVRAAAPIGVCFTFLSLITGALWGKPMWGTWWVWDARLTSVLILFFMYVGYLVLVNAYEEEPGTLKASNIFVLIGFINIPIIKFSVEWWHTLHQPASVMKLAKPSVDTEMLVPLFAMAVAYVCYFLVLFFLRLEKEVLSKKIKSIDLLSSLSQKV